MFIDLLLLYHQFEIESILLIFKMCFAAMCKMKLEYLFSTTYSGIIKTNYSKV